MGILLVLLHLVHHIHRLQDNSHLVLITRMQEEVRHLPLQDVKVVQLEYPWSLKDQHLH